MLRMAENTEKPIWELEKDLALSQGLIRQPQQRYRADEAKATLQPSSEREIVKQERDILKKALQSSHGAAPMKYRFIDNHRAVYPVGRTCQVLDELRTVPYFVVTVEQRQREDGRRRNLSGVLFLVGHDFPFILVLCC